MTFVSELPLGWAIERDERGVRVSLDGDPPEATGLQFGNVISELRSALTTFHGSPEEVEILDAYLVTILKLHADHITTQSRRTASEPLVDEARILQDMIKEETEGISAFKRAARKEAHDRAQKRAQEAIDRAHAERDARLEREQQDIDAGYAALDANHPEDVLRHSEAALAAYALPAAACGVAADELSLVVVLPDVEDLIPGHSLMGGGVYPRSESDRQLLYVAAAASVSLAAARVVLSAAPGIRSVRVCQLSEQTRNATMRLRGVFRFDREELAGVAWNGPEAFRSAARAAHPDVAPDGLRLRPLDPAQVNAEPVVLAVQALGGHLVMED